MKKLIKTVGMLMSLFLLTSVLVSADNATDSKFDASIVKSDKERGDTSRAWYDLKLNPGEKTTLAVSLTNRDTKPATFLISATQAETGSNMVMSANRPINEVQDAVNSSLRLGNSILKVSSAKVTVAAGETREIPAQVTMPSTKIDGSWLGGIHIQKQVASSDQAQNGYTNRFNYMTYVQLSNTDVVTKADLDLKKVSYQSKSQSGIVNIALQNKQNGYVSNASSTVKVHQKGESATVVNDVQSNQSIANGSNFTYQVPTKELKSGKTYVADITIHDNKNNVTWHWTKEFKVSSLSAVSGWLSSNPMTRNNNWLWLLLLIPLLIILFFLWRKQKKWWMLSKTYRGSKLIVVFPIRPISKCVVREWMLLSFPSRIRKAVD